MMKIRDMMDDVVGKFGFEDEDVIKFIEMCEHATSNSDLEEVENEYEFLMSVSVCDDDNEDDEYYDDVDECGFNPYSGCYDYDC